MDTSPYLVFAVLLFASMCLGFVLAFRTKTPIDAAAAAAALTALGALTTQALLSGLDGWSLVAVPFVMLYAFVPGWVGARLRIHFKPWDDSLRRRL